MSEGSASTEPSPWLDFPTEDGLWWLQLFEDEEPEVCRISTIDGIRRLRIFNSVCEEHDALPYIKEYIPSSKWQRATFM